MNLEQLKEMQQDISKRVNVNLAKYDDRQIAYEYYINELDKFLKDNPNNVWATTQKFMAENYSGIRDSSSEDSLKQFLEEHNDIISLEDEALIVNHIIYYELQNDNLTKQTIAKLEAIVNKGVKTKYSLYPLVFSYVTLGDAKVLLYIDDLKSIMGDTLELLLWEALGHRFVGNLDKSCEVLDTMIAKLDNEKKKDNANINCWLFIYSELVRYNLSYNKYLQKDFDGAYELLSILEKEIDNNVAVSLMHYNIFDLYYVMGLYEDVKRVGHKMIGQYANKNFFEYYLYAIYKTDGVEAAKNEMENYLDIATKKMHLEIQDDLELNENNFEYTESLLDEMLCITKAYNNMIINNGIPQIDENTLLFHDSILDCYIENCIVHSH